MHMPSGITDDRPGLTQLQQLQTRGGKPIRLLEGIVPRYGVYGTCLLADDDGVKMSIIKHNHKSDDEITTAIFEKFLQGEIVFLSPTCTQ